MVDMEGLASKTCAQPFPVSVPQPLQKRPHEKAFRFSQAKPVLRSPRSLGGATCTHSTPACSPTPPRNTHVLSVLQSLEKDACNHDSNTLQHQVPVKSRSPGKLGQSRASDCDPSAEINGLSSTAGSVAQHRSITPTARAAQAQIRFPSWSPQGPRSPVSLSSGGKRPCCPEGWGQGGRGGNVQVWFSPEQSQSVAQFLSTGGSYDAATN